MARILKRNNEPVTILFSFRRGLGAKVVPVFLHSMLYGMHLIAILTQPRSV